MKNNPPFRLYLVTAFFVLIGFLLSAKLFFTQIIAGEDYRETAERQYRQSLGRPFNRGSIFFESKDGILISGATLQSSFILAINPTLIVELAGTYERLKTVLPELNEVQFTAKAARREDSYEEIADRLPKAMAAAIRALNLPGVQIIEERYRAYPGGELAAQVLGFMGYQGNEYAGRYGLEKQYDELLRREGELTFATFLSELFSGPVKSSAAGGVGADIISTIEPSVQRFLEDQLETVARRWQTKVVGGIILDPKTGAIFGLAVRPTFDPGKKQSDLTPLTNPLVEHVYEMGSIMKPLTIAAGLDAGAISEETYYNDTGSLSIDGKVISNYDGRARGRVPLQEILNQSLNVGAVFVMRQLGRERFRDYLNGFGLGEKTGVDLPGEVKGLVNNLTNGREIEFATASFGQGIALTPLNITMALSTLANDGYLVKPQIVKRLRYETGLIEEVSVKKVRSVIKADTARRVTAMLVKAVDEVLDGGRTRLLRYRVAAKTGTAQIPRAAEQGYDENKFLHSFFGYFPASAPRFSVFLYALEPLGVNYASQTLTAPFSNLAKFLLNYYQVPPDR